MRIDGRIAFRMTAALALNGSSLIDTPYHTVGYSISGDLPIEGIGQWQNGDTFTPPQRMHPERNGDSSLIQCVSSVCRKRLNYLRLSAPHHPATSCRPFNKKRQKKRGQSDPIEMLSAV
jgi:hypothetical protein